MLPLSEVNRVTITPSAQCEFNATYTRTEVLSAFVLVDGGGDVCHTVNGVEEL